MRILYTITYYLPHVSGLTIGLTPFVQHFLHRGHEVEVLAAQHDANLPREERSAGLTITRIPVALRLGKGPLMPSHAWASWRATGVADVVHIVLPQFDAGLTALVAAIRGRPVILSYICSFTSPGLTGWITVNATRLSHLLAGLVAKRIIALSEDYAEQSRFCRLFRRKLAFVDLPTSDYPNRALPYRKPVPPFRIGFVGRIAPEKNVELLLDAIPHLRELLGAPFTIDLIGPREPAGTPGMTGLAARLSAENSPELVCHGLLQGKALDATFRRMHVHVLPSDNRIEAFGLVQVEAMLRGVPCVASDRPGMRQPVLRTGFGRLFRPSDPRSLAQAVAAVLLDGPPSVPTPEMIHREFHPEAAFAQVEEIYKDALDQ